MANEDTWRMKKPTFSHQLHLCMSFLQETLINFSLKDVRPGKLAFKIHAVIMIPSRSGQTLTKYARIAVTSVQHSALYKKFYRLSESNKKGEQLQLTHIQCAKFHNVFTEDKKLILPDCLHGYQQQASLQRKKFLFSC